MILWVGHDVFGPDLVMIFRIWYHFSCHTCQILFLNQWYTMFIRMVITSTIQVFNKSLTLILILVLDCPTWRFGPNCEQECHCADISEACDSILGICSSGCAQGWEGYNCQTRKSLAFFITFILHARKISVFLPRNFRSVTLNHTDNFPRTFNFSNTWCNV